MRILRMLRGLLQLVCVHHAAHLYPGLTPTIIIDCADRTYSSGNPHPRAGSWLPLSKGSEEGPALLDSLQQHKRQGYSLPAKKSEELCSLKLVKGIRHCRQFSTDLQSILPNADTEVCFGLLTMPSSELRHQCCNQHAISSRELPASARELPKSGSGMT
jgi:hypothetical protein